MSYLSTDSFTQILEYLNRQELETLCPLSRQFQIIINNNLPNHPFRVINDVAIFISTFGMDICAKPTAASNYSTIQKTEDSKNLFMSKSVRFKKTSIAINGGSRTDSIFVRFNDQQYIYGNENVNTLINKMLEGIKQLRNLSHILSVNQLSFTFEKFDSNFHCILVEQVYNILFTTNSIPFWARRIDFHAFKNDAFVSLEMNQFAGLVSCPEICFRLSDCFDYNSMIDYLHLSPAEALAKQAITIEVVSDERCEFKNHFEVAKFVSGLKKSFSEATVARSYKLQLKMKSMAVECQKPFTLINDTTNESLQMVQSPGFYTRLIRRGPIDTNQKRK